MKNYFLLISFSFFLFNCSETSKKSNDEKDTVLVLETVSQSFNEKSPECKEKIERGCARLKASYPILKRERNDSTNLSLQAINDSIYGSFVKVFIEFIPEGNLTISDKPERLIGSFFKKHRKDQAEFEEPIGYELNNEVNVAYYTKKFVSISQSIMTYAGGAHPNSIIIYKTLDLKTGELINTSKWLKDTVKLKATILTKLKEHMQMDLSTDIEEKGFFIPDNEIYISNNILIEKDSVSFMYNQYDIAPYSYGNFTIKLSKEQVGIEY